MIYQIQQTSSQCAQCSRNKLSKTSSESSSKTSQQSSPGQQHQTGHHQHQKQFKKQNRKAYKQHIIPIKKNAILTNRHVEQTLNILQIQVEKLKKENFLKERKIRKLEAQLNKKQYRFYPENAKIGSIYENQLYEQAKNNNVTRRTYTQIDHDYNNYNNYNQQSFLHHQQKNKSLSSHNRNPGIKYHQQHNQNSSRALIQIDEIEKKIKQITQNKNQRIHFLQEQLSKAQFQIRQLEHKLEEQVADKEWLTKFCLSFVRMAGKVAQKVEGKSIIKQEASLRKNAKLSWAFFKKFVKEVIQ